MRHTGPLEKGISIQQASQTGTEQRRGSGEPQREQGAGRRVEPIASRGLRSTRTMARQRDVSDSEPSIVSEPEFLRKTHLTLAAREMEIAAPALSISIALSLRFLQVRCHSRQPLTGQFTALSRRYLRVWPNHNPRNSRFPGPQNANGRRAHSPPPVSFPVKSLRGQDDQVGTTSARGRLRDRHCRCRGWFQHRSLQNCRRCGGRPARCQPPFRLCP